MEKLAEPVDVLIIGAGLSGIGVAWYLQARRPGTRYAILESREALGGTWDLFRYPGVRSDSDIHSYGFAFKPWRGAKVFASAASILGYLREVADESGIGQHIRYRHRVVAANWSSSEARWHVDVERTDTGERLSFDCRWLLCAGGYYRYDDGHRPAFTGIEHFKGRVVHPQRWPEGLDFSGQRVLVIGSGATAATLIPAMADRVAHVTMLQRTPSYVLSLPSEDAFANALPRLLGSRVGHALIRGRNIALQETIVRFCRRFPRAARRLIRGATRRRLPAGFPVDEHFDPPYGPWRQRMCIVPDGDLLGAIKNGKASIVTGRIARFTEHGVQLETGQHLDADLVITATGFNLQPFGGVRLHVDGRAVEPADTVVYKGMMLSGVPNFTFVFGYTTSAWTLKIRLLGEHFCRLLGHLERHGFDTCRPLVPDASLPRRPLLDFGSGYVQRSIEDLPRQGTRYPWQLATNYWSDVWLARRGSVAGPELEFTSRDREAAPRSPALRADAAVRN